MSQPHHVPTTHAIYYSAHRGLVWGPDGAFHHFARQCDLIHTRNGYWKFSTYEDDQRAYAWGFRTPEDVLIAQDVGDGAYDDIILRWVPGTLDESNKPTVGTAAQHLETIYNERRILGKSLSFRGRVPLYPIGTDQRLINHRLMRYGAQKSVLPGTIPIPPAQRSLSTVSQHVPSALTASTERVSSPDPSTVSLEMRLCRSETQPALVAQNLDKQSLKAVALILNDNELNNDHTLQTDLLKNSNLDTNCQPGEQVPYHSQTLHANHAAGCVPLNAIQARSQPTSPRMPSLLTSPKLSVEMPRWSEERAYTDDEVVCCTSYDDDVLDTAADNTFVLSMANLSPTQVFDAQSASLPCFDCGVVGAHAPHCCIAEATQSLMSTGKLTVAEYRTLAENVQRFDPGPWTTHVGRPREVMPVEPKLQLQGMADIIRNLDETLMDPALQTLDDQLTVLLWALTTSSQVEKLKSIHSDFGIGESDAEDCEMPDAW